MYSIQDIIKYNEEKRNRTRKPRKSYEELAAIKPTDFWSSIRQQIAEYLEKHQTNPAELSLLVDMNTDVKIAKESLWSFMAGRYKSLSMNILLAIIEAGVELDLNHATTFDKAVA